MTFYGMTFLDKGKNHTEGWFGKFFIAKREFFVAKEIDKIFNRFKILGDFEYREEKGVQKFGEKSRTGEMDEPGDKGREG